MEQKIIKSFKDVFDMDILKIEIFSDYANVMSENNNRWYNCRITKTKRIKKNSWRMYDWGC